MFSLAGFPNLNKAKQIQFGANERWQLPHILVVNCNIRVAWTIRLLPKATNMVKQGSPGGHFCLTLMEFLSQEFDRMNLHIKQHIHSMQRIHILYFFRYRLLYIKDDYFFLFFYSYNFLFIHFTVENMPLRGRIALC